MYNSDVYHTIADEFIDVLNFDSDIKLILSRYSLIDCY